MTSEAPARGAPVDRLPLAVSVGDPAGVGPLVSVRAALAARGGEGAPGVVLFGDAERLEAMVLAEVGGRRVDVPRVDPDAVAGVGPGTLAVCHAATWADALVERRAPTPEGGRAQVAALDAATAAVHSGRARALVTGPTSKDAISRSGVPFVGQTEHLAAAAGLPPDAVTMMFLGERLRVALVTTHLAVRSVPEAIDAERVERTVVHLADAVGRLEGPAPARAIRLCVTGLNPHAGEQGLFGDEEARAIVPGMERARAHPLVARAGVRLEGPIPAETAFREAAAGRWQGVVTMMHDQATIASKLLDWGRAVNVTWGLPFVRTSVDHGVAYDAAASGRVEHEGMAAALAMARRLSEGGRP